MREAKVVYFDDIGKENTDDVLRLAKERADELGIKTVLVASTTGWTAVKALDVFDGLRLIVVTHSYGFRVPDVCEFAEDNRKVVEGRGVPIVSATHAFGGISRAMRQGEIKETQATYVVGDLVATTLRIFGQGMKVACEITAMAVDTGLVRTDEEVISIAGTGRLGGADTAIVLKPEAAHRIFDLRVREIICKPRL